MAKAHKRNQFKNLTDEEKFELQKKYTSWTLPRELWLDIDVLGRLYAKEALEKAKAIKKDTEEAQADQEGTGPESSNDRILIL
jgi:hypothetical protein